VVCEFGLGWSLIAEVLRRGILIVGSELGGFGILAGGRGLMGGDNIEHGVGFAGG